MGNDVPFAGSYAILLVRVFGRTVGAMSLASPPRRPTPSPVFETPLRILRREIHHVGTTKEEGAGINGVLRIRTEGLMTLIGAKGRERVPEEGHRLSLARNEYGPAFYRNRGVVFSAFSRVTTVCMTLSHPLVIFNAPFRRASILLGTPSAHCHCAAFFMHKLVFLHVCTA